MIWISVQLGAFLHDEAMRSSSHASRTPAGALLLGVIAAVAPIVVPAADADAAFRQRIAACTSCHGERGEGFDGADAAPRLAGKPAAYLALQLRYFQSGQRRHATMSYMVRYLDPDYLRAMADYFARQDVPYPHTASPAATDDAMRRGEQLVRRGDGTRGLPSCVSCHGTKLSGVQPLIPGLAGLSTDYLQAQLQAWRKHVRGAREPDCMAVVANRMQASDVQAVAAWLASRETPATAEPAQARTPEPLPGWCVLDTGT